MKKKIVSLLLSVIILVVTIAMWVPGVSASTNGMIRVWLKSMDYDGSIYSTSVTLSGSYSVPSNQDIQLTTRGTYSVSVSTSGTLLLSGTGIDTPVDMGTSFTMKTHANDDGSIGTISLYNTKYGNRAYRGDMLFMVNNGALRLINTVYIEDYLYGVLAGELSNTFPLETLKAQAIIARSYAYNKMQNGSSSYDITDCSDCQVYKGYNSSNDVIINAVDSTAGILLKYDGSVVNAYFSASNGGQVELPGNAWSSSTSLGCYVMKDDSYDLNNVSSRIVTYTFSSSPDSLDSSLYALIQGKVYTMLGSYPTILSIDAVTLSDPIQTDKRSVGISRNYQTMNMTLTVQGTQTVFDGTQSSNYGDAQQVNISLSLHDEVKYTVFSADSDLRFFALEQSGSYYYLTLARYGHGVGMSQRGAQQMAKEGMTYKQIINFYFNDCSLPTVSFTKDALTKYVPLPSSPIGTAEITASSLTVRAEPSTSATKLGSLTKGSVVDVYANDGSWLTVVYNGTVAYISASYANYTDGSGTGSLGVGTEGVAASASPTASNSAELLASGDGTATVTLKSASSTLKLRSTASSSGSVITNVPNGTVVTVLAKGTEWTQVMLANGTKGYMATSYLTFNSSTATETASATATATATATAASEDTVVAYGLITGSSVNVRSGPSTSASKVGSLLKGSAVAIISQNNGFYKIKYNNGTAYVSSSYVNVTGTANTATPAPSASVSPSPTPTAFVTQTLMVTADYVIVAAAPGGNVGYEQWPKGTVANILGESGDYYIVYSSAGQCNGYVPKSGFGTVSAEPTQTIPAGSTYISATSAYLYSSPGSSVRNAELSYGTVVTIQGESGDYYYVYVASEKEYGYVIKSSVSTASAAPTATTSPSGTTSAGTIKLSSSSSTLNMRASASTSSAVVTTLKNGASVTITGESGDWYAITYGNYSGYVMKKYVTTGSSSDTGTSSSSGKYPATIRLASATSTVNVRAGAGTNTSKLGTLSHGAAVNVVAQNGDWYKIEYGTGYGYVLKSYVVLSTDSGSSSSSSTTSTTTAKTTSNVNLRSSASTSGTKLGTYVSGTQVTVLEKGSTWSKVSVDGKTGYMKNDYLKF